MSRRVGWVALVGEDGFPAGVEELLRSWEVLVEVKVVAERKTTRGRLEYLDEVFGGE